MHRTRLAATIATLIIACLALRLQAGEGGRRGTPLFFRVLGAQSNAPILPKARSGWTQNRQVRTGTTGSSDYGFTEFPFCWGRMDFTFVEHAAVYPRLVSGVQADETRMNTADILIDHVYEPDGCVWGLTGRELVQTFTATQRELVSVTLMVASKRGTFLATLLDGGPGGRPIGPSRPFTSGHSMEWGTARWKAGDAPLVPGRAYGIRSARADGEPWTPYLHATGSAYDGGMLHVDGVAHPESDLAAWIVEEPPDLRRALLPDADADGWVRRAGGIAFVPRAPNVRLISLTLSPVTADERKQGHVDLVARVWSADGTLVGGPKRCIAGGPADGPHTAHFLFATDELKVTPGQRYRIDAHPWPHKRDDLPGKVRMIPRDLQARVYGEPQPGALPAIASLTATVELKSKLRLRWVEPFPCPTRIEIDGLGVNKGKRVDVPAGQTEIRIPSFWEGHAYDIRLISTGPTGLTWRTPLYQIRFPRADGIEPIRQPEYPDAFVTIAPPRRSAAPDYGPLRYIGQIEVANPSFEDGLTGWRAGGDDKIGTTGSLKGIGVKWGKAMAGWSLSGGGKREQVFAESSLSQRIPTKPGHVYVLSAWAHTSVVNGPRGDTRVRLFADPEGGETSDGANASQWYWTDGRWMRFQHRWRARAGHATIGLGLFRWRDLDRASAFVDHVTVFDLGPAPPAARPALAGERVEAGGRVEAHLAAPPGYLITGIGARAHYDNVTTMWLRVQPLLPDGSLGPPEQLRGGWEPDAGLEARIDLPDGFVATGFGARAAPEWDVKSLVVWGRPLGQDGTLGEEREFRGGKEPDKGPEKALRLDASRVLTAAGLNCMHNDINRIRAASARPARTGAGSRD